MAVRFATDPAWQGAGPGFGWGPFVGVAALVVVLTVWTYLRAGVGSRRRLAIVLALRLTALAVTALLILRPSLATEEEAEVAPSRAWFVVDFSRSMATGDEFGNASRIDHVRKLWADDDVQATLARLASDRNFEWTFRQAAVDVKPFDPTAPVDGARTDIYRWLDDVLREQGRDESMRGGFLFSDGIDTGDAARTLRKAAEFRGRFPLHAFGVGQPNTVGQDKDIALDRIYVDPPTIVAKGKFKVKVAARAVGFDGAVASVSLAIEEPNGKMTKVKTIDHRYRGPDDEIAIEADAPDRDGEIKIVLRSEPLPGETSATNNEIVTFADVTKEGVRVLWVEGQRRWEYAIPIRECFRKDRRFQIVTELRPRGVAPAGPLGGAGENQLGKKAYDVLVIGDLSASRFGAGDSTAFQRVRDLVQNGGMGLLMLGGYETFAGSDWQQSPLRDFFPVRFDKPGQFEAKVRLAPTPDGASYVLKLADDPKRNAEIFGKLFGPLEGIANPGTLEPTATLLAGTSDDPQSPVMAAVQRGKGRVMTFAGDTTSIAWRRSPDAQAAYDRFWKQTLLWLAQQETSQGEVFVRLDERRVDRNRRASIGFRVGFRGAEAKGATFVVKAIGPRKEEYPLTVASDGQGKFAPPGPGEYAIVVKGSAVASSGAKIDGAARARFLATEDDPETARVGADHDFLEKLASASGGRFARADKRELIRRLEELVSDRSAEAPRRVTHFPDWRRMPASGALGDQLSALWRSAALACLIVYLACLCTEWYLPRRWGLA